MSLYPLKVPLASNYNVYSLADLNRKMPFPNSLPFRWRRKLYFLYPSWPYAHARMYTWTYIHTYYYYFTTPRLVLSSSIRMPRRSLHAGEDSPHLLTLRWRPMHLHSLGAAVRVLTRMDGRDEGGGGQSQEDALSLTLSWTPRALRSAQPSPFTDCARAKARVARIENPIPW